MIRRYATYAYLLLFSLNSFASLEAPLRFNGQNAEPLKLEKVMKVTRSFPKEIETTCTRQVPYEVYRCHDVTRYRQECSWVPARQECRTEYDRQCRSVTRYREECTRGPSRQECHTTPTRQVCTDRPSRQVCTQLPSREECSTTPSRQVCTDRPSREVCTERPTREVCTTRPDGRQHCTTVGGGQHCTTVGGGQDCRTVGGDRQCRTVPGGQHCTTVGGGQDCRTVGGDYQCRTVEGDPICRSVPYSDQECTNVPRQACETIPGHNACTDVPYEEEVCGNETAYRPEQYACTQTIQEERVVEKKVSAVVNVAFKTNGSVEEFGALVTLIPDAKGKVFSPVMKLTSEPKTLVVVKKKEAKIRAESETEVRVEGEIEVELQNAPKEEIEFPAIESAKIDKKTSLLTVIFGKALPTEAGRLRTGDLFLEVSRKGQVLAKLEDKFPGKKVEVKKIEKKDAMVMNLKDLIQGPLSGGLFSKGPVMKLELKLPSKVQGEILNAKKPQTEKLYENVKLKTK